MTAAWRAALEDARRARDVTPAQLAWDGQFARRVAAALRAGQVSAAAVEIAYTRTEDQHGQRPTNPDRKSVAVYADGGWRRVVRASEVPS